jgi:hypothetical protein
MPHFKIIELISKIVLYRKKRYYKIFVIYYLIEKLFRHLTCFLARKCQHSFSNANAQLEETIVLEGVRKYEIDDLTLDRFLLL